jgi:hypothetical protein
MLHDITDEQLIRRAIRNAKPNRLGPAPRWVAVMDTFALGSNYAAELCRQYDMDPDEEVPGLTCPHCDTDDDAE